MVILPPNYTSLPSTVAIFLVTHLIVVLQPFRYSIFYGRDTPFDLVFHNGVTPVSISILKPPLGIIGVIPLKP